MMKPPRVSVVIPAHNHESYVGEAIQSVLDQSFADFELIIINDGSTDHTEEEILKFRDPRIRYVAQENRGLSVTLNRGVELARGDYFNFLPSDDTFYPEKLEVQLRAFEEDPDLGVLFAYPRIVDAGGQEIEDRAVAGWPIVPFETKEEIFPALFERNFLSAPTALIKTDCLRKVGGFDPFLRYAQDYDLWMRILKFYGARLLKQPLVTYRWHGGNETYQSTTETELERAKILLKAYRELDLGDVFPCLRLEKDPRLHARAWRTLAAYAAKSGVPALEPIRLLYEEKARSLESAGFPLASVRETQDQRGSPVGVSSSLHPRVHVLVETASFDKGGLEQVVFDLATGLRPELFQAVVVVVERGGALEQRCKERGIPVEVLRYDKAKEYRAILERYAIDVVLSHYSTFGTRLSFEKGIPVLSVLHNIYSWFPETLFSEFRFVDPFVSRYVAVSDEVKEYARFRFNIPAEKIVVIPNGMDMGAYRSRPPGAPVTRSDLGWREEDYVFVNVAAISPPKGQNVILAALRQIVKEDPSIRVLSVGGVLDEGYFQLLQKSVKEFGLSNHFRFIGFAQDVRPYLEMADAFLLTSFVEGWPLSVMEGMLHRLPVLSTQVSGISTLFGESGGGLIVPNRYEDYRLLKESSIDDYSKEPSPGHAGEVAHAMGRFARERASWREAGLRGYERIVTHFDLRQTLRSYEGELLPLFTTREWRRRQLLLDLNHEKDEALRQGEQLLKQRERTVDELKDQLAYEKEVVAARIQQLESNIRLLQDRLDKRFEYLLVRLSLSERMKGLVFRLMKKVHLLVPVPLREKYRARYREVFFDRVTPSDQRGAGPPAPLAAGEVEQTVRGPGGTPRQEFLRFKREIRRGLPVESERFCAGQVHGRVSVVLPVYNQAQYVGQAIESVLRQTYGEFELIVVDDGSYDGTARALDPYRRDPRITVIEQTNQKLPKALSNGFRQARGEFYTWTSADNLMHERHLEVLVEFLSTHPRVQMVYADYDLIDDDGNPLLNSDYCPGYQKPLGSNHIHLPRDPSDLNVIRNNYIGPCFLYRGWVGRLVGDYDPSMFTLEDYDYWMTINTFFRIEHLGRDDLLYFNRVHDKSLTGRKAELKIVENTDRLMEFERKRREFYRKAFHVYLLGNNERLSSIGRGYRENGQRVKTLSIPCENTAMGGEKNLGIWIYSEIEEGFARRVMEENPQAFFVMILLNGNGMPGKELCERVQMRISLSESSVGPRDNRGFYAETLSDALYPILCKANIELLRRKEPFHLLKVP